MQVAIIKGIGLKFHNKDELAFTDLASLFILLLQLCRLKQFEEVLHEIEAIARNLAPLAVCISTYFQSYPVYVHGPFAKLMRFFFFFPNCSYI